MTLTLSEAIDHCEEVAEEQERISTQCDRDLFDHIDSCRKCASEHRQLAEWLKELKAYRKIIFELSEAMHWYDGCEKCQGFREYPTSDFVDDVRSWVKQFEEVNADDSN